MSWIAFIFILPAIGLHLFRKRRVFQRTNSFDIERFENCSSQLGAQLIDRALRFGSLILSVSGVLMLSYVHLDSWGWIVIAPALAFVLFLFI